MRIAHLLPRQRGNVAVDNYTFVNALLWMCRTGARGGTCRSATASGSPSTSGSTAGPGTARLFTALQEERIIAVEVRVPALDSTSVKVHRHAVRVCK